MEKQITVVSYWLGIACVALTIIFRVLAAVGIWPILVPGTEPASLTEHFITQPNCFCCYPSRHD